MHRNENLDETDVRDYFPDYKHGNFFQEEISCWRLRLNVNHFNQGSFLEVRRGRQTPNCLLVPQRLPAFQHTLYSFQRFLFAAK